MKGLVIKDLVAYHRRTNTFSRLFVIVIDLLLILFMRNIYSLVTVAILIVPVNMAASATTLKEIDGNNNFAKYILTLPYSWKDFVRGRYLAALTDGAMEALLGLIMVILHFVLCRTFSFPVYLLYWAAGVLMGLAFIAANVMASFMAGLNASAIVYMLSIFVVLGGFLATAFLDIDIQAILNLPAYMLWILGIALCLIMSVSSYFLSMRAMRRNRRKS